MTDKTAVEPLLYSIPAAGKMLGGVSRSTVLRMIDRGELRSIKVGTRTMVIARSITEFVDE